MKTWKNVLGQVRIYSLVDLLLFVVAIGYGWGEGFGIVLLHLGFLFYLEAVHQHPYRMRLPQMVWVSLWGSGIFFFSHWTALPYIFASVMYAKKGVFSPFWRGAQYFCFTGSLRAFSLMALRNFAGDLRDVTKDEKEGMRTLPLVLGVRRDYNWAHPIVLLITTTVWWWLADINVVWLALVYLIQSLTYNLTPR